MQVSTSARLSLFYFAVFGALGAYLPYFPLWLEALGYDGWSISILMSLVPAMSIACPPLTGLLADALGIRSHLLRVFAVAACVSVLGLWWADSQEYSRRFAVVFAAMLLFAWARSGLVMLADVITLELPGHYARRRLWGSVGFMLVAGVVGVWETDHALLPALMSVAFLAALALSFTLPKTRVLPSAPVWQETRRILSDRRFCLFLGCSGLAIMAHSSYDLCISWYLRDLGASPGQISIAWVLGTSAEIALMAVAGPTLRRFRVEYVLMAAYAGACVRWLALANTGSVAALLVLQALHAVSFGLMWLGSMAYLQRSTRPGLLATAQGLFLAAFAAGGVLGRLSWGPLYSARGGQRVFFAAAVLAAMATLLSARLVATRQRGAVTKAGEA